MTAGLLALEAAAVRLVKRLQALEVRLEAGEEAAWEPYAAAAAALAAILPALRPEAGGRALTTRELAARFAVSPKTIRRAAKEGRIAQPLRLGQRGRGALRWPAEVAR